MKNDSKIIFERQNEQGMINAQKAAHYSYLTGKRVIFVLATVSIIIPIISNVLLLLFNNIILANLLSVIGVCCFLGGEILRLFIKRYKFYGAGLQQYFDEFVFGLKNSCRKYIPPKKLTFEQRLSLLKKYEKKDNAPFVNWYSDYSSLPYEKAVYYCQKENIRWDKKLREKYIAGLVISLFIIILAFVIHAIFYNKSTNDLIAILVSIAPVFSYLIHGIIKLCKDLNNQKNILSCIENIETKMTSSKKIWDEVEELQVEIFKYRKTNYLIPNWFYNLFRKSIQKNEDDLAQGISERVK